MCRAIYEQDKEIAALMTDFVGYAVDFYEHLSDYPVVRPADRKMLDDISLKVIPTSGRPLQEVYQELLREVFSTRCWLSTPEVFPVSHPRRPCSLGWEIS